MDTIYFVYILFSESFQKFYVGQTSDLVRRLEEHAQGKSVYTSTGRPWRFVASMEVFSRKEALLLESKIKKRGIKRYLIDKGLI